MTRVKICGLTRREDVQLAARLGADALGFVFAGGPRSLTPAQCRDLTAVAPPFVNRVGVFGPDHRQDAPAIAEACRLDTLQILGPPDPAFCAYFRGRFAIVAAVGVTADPDLNALAETIADLAPHVDGILLDTAKAGMLGGTGQTFDWSVLSGMEAVCPIIVAGGLNPENVAALVAQAQPWGVDVSSGIESAPGVKDPAKLAAFLKAAKG